MAGPIGRITTALATVHNENSVALANFNFDFTLVKLEAPAEYNALGQTISKKRKMDAETGALHKTARRLGALFEDLLPATEDLFRAYGTRVSEISSMPAINPREGKDGIFASHVGIDTASIWAAVTSGSAAIAVDLLACMLARMFTGPEAISVWVELVEKQKDYINGRSTRLYSNEHYPAMAAAQQDISRADLAAWDASARAWLQSADQAKALQHKQTMLILNNTNVPVNSETEIYASVKKAWVTALEAMNSLVKGLPQRVQDGSALLAISSWHLYPDISVYGGQLVEVKQKDSIFDRAALLTLGLEHVRDDTSVYWSLPLAYLQYYGHPIQASRTLGQENSRITCQQFAYVVLGCVFEGWPTFAEDNETGLQWVRKTADLLRGDEKDAQNLQNTLPWLHYIFKAAQEITDSEGFEKKAAYQLLQLGRRRSTFLNQWSANLPPFDLSRIEVFLPLLKTDVERVDFMRQLGCYLKADTTHTLIKYRTSRGESWLEYATIAPRAIPPASTQECITEVYDAPIKHVRFIHLSFYDLQLCIRRSEEFKNPAQCIEKLKELKRLAENESAEGSTTAAPDRRESREQRRRDAPRRLQEHKRKKELKEQMKDLEKLVMLGTRKQEIEQLGETYLPVCEPLCGNSLVFSLQADFVKAAISILKDLKHDGGASASVPSTFLAGCPDLAALIALTSQPVRPLHGLILSPLHLEPFYKADKIHASQLSLHLYTQHTEQQQSLREQIRNIEACSLMTKVYKLLPGATISTLILRQSLAKAKWLPKFEEGVWKTSLTLPQAFACVAMFESGTCNLDPNTLKDVFAMSSGNSLYVSAALLCDPYDQPAASEIRRVVGNIGRAGITFLIPPPDVKIREPDPERWMSINHAPFDGSLENYFERTSIHLSFTKYEISLVTEDNPQHLIDRDVVLVETLVSVYDGGAWVAEIDVLKTARSQVHLLYCAKQGSCSQASLEEKNDSYKAVQAEHPHLVATSVENWDELIEAPAKGMIAVKAYKNWLARLAATAVCIKLDFIPVILPENVCWRCCADIVSRDYYDNKVALIC